MDSKVKNKLSAAELNGFVSLLEGADEKLLHLLTAGMINFSASSLSQIDELINSKQNPEILENWNYISRLNLTKSMQEWKQSGDLETGLFLISRFRTPGLDEERFRAILDNYAHRINQRLSPQDSTKTILQTINEVLFKEEAFIGNQLDYYDIDNSFLHKVIERKTGNPIMLSCLYILVGRRLGLDLKGVGTPGHFILALDELFIDPFFGGRLVSREECVMRAQELGVHWRDEYLVPISDELIISRSIRNMVSIYKKQNDFDNAESASSLLRLV